MISLLADRVRHRCRWLVAAVFLACLAVGLVAVGDVGSGWDEAAKRSFAVLAIEDAKAFIHEGRVAPRRNDAEHGRAHELLLFGLERALSLDVERDPRAVYRMRHLVTFSVFFLAAIIFYLFMRDALRSRALALLGAVFFLLHPRVLHHSFHNSSDIFFLAASVFALYTLVRFVSTPGYGWAVVHGATTAFAVDIRIVGAMLVVLTVGCLSLRALSRGWRWSGRVLRPGALYLLSGTVFVVAMWPLLWGAPLENFVWAWQVLSTFYWPGYVRYLHEVVSAADLPWHYNFVWIGITTPLLVVALALLGAGWALYRGRLSPAAELHGNLPVLVMVGWLVASLAAPILLGSTLFDGWRHHFFVYPAIVFLAVVGARVAYRTGRAAWPRAAFAGAVTVLVAHFSTTAWSLWSLHPHQNVYFNGIGDLLGAGRTPYDHGFDMDYWGLSYRRGLEHLARTDPGEFTVYDNHPVGLNHVWLAPEDRRRIRTVSDLREADYFLGTYRLGTIGVSLQSPRRDYPSHFGEEIYRVETGASTILTVRQRRPPAPRP